MEKIGKLKKSTSPRIEKISILGSGIVGLMTATLIKSLIPETIINIYDAGEDPRKSSKLVGTTFGQGKDSRQFTGSESLSYQNPIHSRALRLAPGEHKDWAGWRVIPENELTKNEKRWRSDSANRFVEIGHENLNMYDDLHAQLNYAGMMAWEFLQKQIPYIYKYRLSNGPYSVFFLTSKNFEDDLESEGNFLNKFGDPNNHVIVSDSKEFPSFNTLKTGLIYKKSLQLPGSTWRIKSLGLKMIADLKDRGVTFNWKKEITDSNNLSGDAVIWTVGTTHIIPDIYKKYSLIQGIAGCWVSIPNPGFTKPFKISLPQPSGYINCTPDGDVMHISGGFGWVGERSYSEAVKLMDPISQHFKEQINRYFGICASDMSTNGRYPVSICIRPSSPTGLPDVRIVNIKNQKNIILTGSGKSGSTQAPLLALYAISEIDPTIINQYKINSQVRNAIKSLGSLHKIHKFGNSTDYPSKLEKDLFRV